MKVFRAIIRIFFLIVAIGLLALSIGTLVPKTPFFGSIAAYITMGWYRVFIPATAALFLAVIIFFLVKRKWLNLLSAAFLAATIVICCVCLSSVIMTFREAGAMVDVAKTYSAKIDGDVQVKTVPYATSDTGEAALDVYYREDGKTGKPIVAYIHGGGWTSGDKSDHAYYWRKAAEAGYVAVSIGYDLSDKEHHRVNTCEKQLTAAFAYLNTHAAEYGASCDRLYLTGDSAGGNLALELAYKINDGVYSEWEGVALPKVKAVAVTYPVAYPAVFWHNDDMILGKPSKEMCESYTGTTPEQDEAVYDDITPANYIDAFTPPTMIIVGKCDTMVQPEQSYDLAKALEAAGIENRLVALPYLNHGFDTQNGDVLTQGVLSLLTQWFEAHP